MEVTGLGSAILNFSLYFALSVSALIIFKAVFPLITPHNEWELIKEKQNVAASIAFGGAILGYAIALYGAASNSVDLIDFVIWMGIAFLAQMIAFAIIRFIFMPKVVARIENNEVSAGIIVAAFSIAVGLLNAACMTY